MNPTDAAFGSYEFPTNVTKDDEGYWVVEAAGFSSRNSDQSQAINDLNQQLMEAIQTGKLTPGF